MLKQPRHFRSSSTGSGDQRYFWSGAARCISGPIFFETFGACPTVVSPLRGTAPTSVAASGTVATGGLSGVALCNPVGAFFVSCDGAFCADTLVVTSNAAATTKRDSFTIDLFS